MESAASTLERSAWTPRLSRAFVEALRKEINENGSRHYSDRTINRVAAHLKTFAKWIHKLRPFPLGNPTDKLKGLALNGVLELERALTPDERRRLLDAADHLPVLGGRSRDRRRCKDIEIPDERPRRKGYRPWRNQAIIYTLIETGMRRAEVTSIDVATIDVEHHALLITEKGGQQRKCQISKEGMKVSKEGMKAIGDYLREERGADQEMFPNSPALFLPADTVTGSAGRLSPSLINRIWNELCVSARVRSRTPHPARHAWASTWSRRPAIPAPRSGSSATRTPPPPCNTCSLRGRRCSRRWMTGSGKLFSSEGAGSACVFLRHLPS